MPIKLKSIGRMSAHLSAGSTVQQLRSLNGSLSHWVLKQLTSFGDNPSAIESHSSDVDQTQPRRTGSEITDPTRFDIASLTHRSSARVLRRRRFSHQCLDPSKLCGIRMRASSTHLIFQAHSTLATLTRHPIRKLSLPEVRRLKRPRHIRREPLIRRARDRFDQKPGILELQINGVLA